MMTIERLSDAPSCSTLVAEAASVAARSFAGTTATAPEGGLDWCHGPELRGGAMTADDALPWSPLSSSAGRERLRWFGNFCAVNFRVGVRHGGCFVLKNSDGCVVACTVSYPPGVDRNGLPPGIDPTTLTTMVDEWVPQLPSMLGLPTVNHATDEWRQWWCSTADGARAISRLNQLGEAGEVVRKAMQGGLPL
jgi:hypothetical protein|eukprot:COSAG02_NODE_352_length_24036_cov_20.479258_5_plen_193_part_00